jgi:nucleolysin TIA-1/TIAR
MSDNGPPPPGSQLPPPQPSAGAPGYENGQNSMGNPHMPPPPLPPVIIPQNTNPIPTALTSPMIGENGVMMSPDSQGGFVRRAAPEPNKRALYVGGLDPRVTEDVLRQIFETTGHVQNVKIIPDKNVGAVSIKFIRVKSLSFCLPVLLSSATSMSSFGLVPKLDTFSFVFSIYIFSMLIAV